MQAYCEGRQKVPVYVPTAVAPSLVTRDIRAPKENVFIACLFKAEWEANNLNEHCLVLCHFFTYLFFLNNEVLYLWLT